MKYSSISPDTRPELQATILAHYDRVARELPWRRDTDPYRVLVSEVMLQQTRVETVVGYYDQWLKRFPSVDALAAADEDDVLKAWEGLGYYRRARNLHKAARVVRERHHGTIPGTSSELRSLPGVGEYTAGAVASIAFGEPAPAVDGNVRRVFSRLFDVAVPSPAWLRERATELVVTSRPGDWNQALMELGATVCVPRAPRCADCPISEWCAARHAGTQAERPAPPKRRTIPSAQIGLALFHQRGRVLLERRPDSGLLAGMWAFPEFTLTRAAIEAHGPAMAADRRVLELAGSFGLVPAGVRSVLPDVRHRFSHLEARYAPTALEVEGDVRRELVADVRWLTVGEEPDVAVPVAQRRVYDSWCVEHAAEHA